MQRAHLRLGTCLAANFEPTGHMSSSETLSGDLTELQHRSRKRSLTAHHASRAHHAAESIVLAGSEMLLVSNACGDILRGRADSQGLGLFHRDTRFLSAYELTLNGAPLVPGRLQHRTGAVERDRFLGARSGRGAGAGAGGYVQRLGHPRLAAYAWARLSWTAASGARATITPASAGWCGRAP